MFQLWLLY